MGRSFRGGMFLCCLWAAVAAAAPTVPAVAAAPNKDVVEQLLKDTDQLTQTVSTLRKLKKLKSFARGVLSKAEIGDRLKAKIAKEYTPGEIAAESRVLKRLGLLPATLDYEQTIIDLLMEQVAGFYDPDAKTLFIADWLAPELQRPALAHEIEHALQDQHWNLDKMMKGLKDNTDAQLARSALIEGDGMGVMTEYMLVPMGQDLSVLAEMPGGGLSSMIEGAMGGQSPQFDKAPKILQKTLLFPYLDGLTFIAQIRRRQPWSKVDEVFKSPPASTEQILHPAKYWAHEKPIKVKGADALASLPGQKLLRADVMGELQIKVFLTEYVGLDATAAAAGWGGDRMVAFTAGPEAPVSIVHVSAWDADADAIEFFVAEARAAAKLAGKDPASVKSTDTVVDFTDASGDLWSLERKGNKVVALLGVHGASGDAAAVRAEVWKKFKFGG